MQHFYVAPVAAEVTCSVVGLGAVVMTTALVIWGMVRGVAPEVDVMP